MKRLPRSIWLLGLFSALSVAQETGFSTRSDHAASHSKDSFVLVFGKQSIERGPDYSTRASALDYQRAKHVRDLVWYSTSGGCFVSVDPKVIASLKETEKPQDLLAKDQVRVGGTDLPAAHQLSLEQNRLTWQRDEVVWSLFDRLQKERRLTQVKCR